MKRNSARPRILLPLILACAAPASAQEDVAPTPGEQAALQQLERDPQFRAMAVEVAELERLQREPQNQRAIETWHRSLFEMTRHHLRSVSARGDARSLLAAAMLWPESPEYVQVASAAPISQERRAWFDAARRALPRDTLVAWVEASGCGGLSDSCDRQGALQFLLQADPANAAVQLLAFGDAEARGDAEAASRYWAAAAAANSYDPRTLEMGQLLHAAVGDMALPPLDARVAPLLGRSLRLNRDITLEDLRHAGALAVWMAQAIPAFQPITRRCPTASPLALTVETQAQCERVMTLLAADQSVLLAPMIGLRKMVELTGDGPEGAAWRERLRQFYWVHESAGRSMGHGDGTSPPGYMNWVLQEGELPALRKLLEANRIDPVAPEGWLPQRAEIRTLLMSTAAKG